MAQKSIQKIGMRTDYRCYALSVSVKGRGETIATALVFSSVERAP